jgi:hypothetical protein
MREQVPIEKLAGHRIEAVHVTSGLERGDEKRNEYGTVLLLEGNKFAYLVASYDTDYGYPAVEIMNGEVELEYGEEEGVWAEVGVLTEDEANAIAIKRIEERAKEEQQRREYVAKASEAADRREYERLKRKYEGKKK